MKEWIQLLAAPLVVIAVVLRRTERRVISALESSGANSESNAMELPPIHRLARWQLARLESYGAVVNVGGNSYYLNPARYKAFRAARRRRAAIIVPILAVIALTLWHVSR